MLAILGVAVWGTAGWAIVLLARGAATYRAGPWPALSARGAGLLLVCSAMLLGSELVVGTPRRAWPDLVWLSLLSVMPPLVGTCIVRAPGCASAVCGVYLLGRSVAALVEPGLELPPLLLPAAVACDLAMWLVRDDLRWPARNVWRRPRRAQRGLSTWRVAAGGAAFGAVLALVEPPYALLLGADPANWTSGDRLLAGGLATLGCACVGAGIVQLGRQVGADVEAGAS